MDTIIKEAIGESIAVKQHIVNDENMLINKNIAIDSRVVVVRRGKKKYFLGIIK